MSKKSFIIILVLSVVVTYLTPVLEILIGGLSIFGGENGLPFKFHKSSFSGLSNYNFTLFTLDIIFWFIVLYFIWQLYKKFLKR